jgi:hypothetical protein
MMDLIPIIGTEFRQPHRHIFVIVGMTMADAIGVSSSIGWGKEVAAICGSRCKTQSDLPRFTPGG